MIRIKTDTVMSKIAEEVIERVDVDKSDPLEALDYVNSKFQLCEGDWEYLLGILPMKYVM